MEKKVHVKLHKVKKHWVTILVTGLVLGLTVVSTNQVAADEQVNPAGDTPVQTVISDASEPAPSSSQETTEQSEKIQPATTAVGATAAERSTETLTATPTETISEQSDGENTTTADTETPDTSSDVTTSENPIQENADSATPTDGTESPTPEVTTETDNITGGQWYSDEEGHWHYKKDDQDLVGAQVIDGQEVYFDTDGKQVKGNFASDGHYYDGELGRLQTASFVTTGNNKWYYVDKNGDKLTGLQEIDGKTYYFDDSGRQTKGERVVVDGKGYYFHPENGELWNNKIGLRFRQQYVNGTSDDSYYYYDDDGQVYTGTKIIDGKEYLFQPAMVHYQIFKNPDGTESYYNEHGQKVYNGWGNLRLMYLKGYMRSSSVYADENGHIVHGFKRIDEQLYYFDEEGTVGDDYPHMRTLFQVDGNWYYAQRHRVINGRNSAILTNALDLVSIDKENPASIADENGKLTAVTARKAYVTAGGKWYYVDETGNPLKGAQVIDSVRVNFRDDYSQVKGDFAPDGHYYDKDSGALVTNRYVEKDGNWYYVNDQGDKLTGAQTVDFVKVYFTDDGIQVKGDFAPDGHFYDKDSGALITNRYVEKDGNWYYVDSQGNKLTGAQTIDFVDVYFDENGVQAKGIFTNLDYYYDKDSGALVRDQMVDVNGQRYYVGPDGRKVYSGSYTVKGEEVHLIRGDAHQAFGEFTGHGDSGDYIDFDGKKVTTAGFVRTKDNHWYYLDGKGSKLTSVQVIDGQLYYFGLPTYKYYYGLQSRGELITAHYADPIPDSSNIYYLDEATGAALKNQYQEWQGHWYYFGPNWYALTGEQTIDGVPVYFHSDGKQAKGELVTIGDTIHYYDADTGARVSNTSITIDGQTYQFNADGDGMLIR